MLQTAPISRQLKCAAASTCSAALLLLVLLQHAPAQIFVDAAATGANDGSSWNDAFISLQDGIAASAPGNGTNQVFVAQGTYFPDEGAAQINNDRNATFNLKNSVSILGGFASGDLLADRAPATKVTILSGDIDQNPATSSTANSHHVVTADSVGSSARLDGVTVRDGDATTVNPREGGGILCINFGSATFSSCIIENNTADNGAAANIDDSFPTFSNCVFQNNTTSGGGAAIRVESGARPFINVCTFRNNTAREGGAIQASGSTTDFHVRDCLFEDNTATTLGGAISVTSNTPEIETSTFRRNHANIDGGAIRYGGRVNTIQGCIFEDNTADDNGGAIRLITDLTLEDCTFTSNSSRLRGGAIHTSGSGSEFFLVGCNFTSNFSTTRQGGAVSNEDNPCSITGCTFTSNTGTFGGALFNDNCDALVTNCLFEGNEVTRSGGAVSGTGSANPTFTNCAFAGNFTPEDGGALQQTNGVPVFINCSFQGNAADREGGALSIPRATITNCLFWQNAAANSTTTQLASIDFRSTQSFSTFSHCMVENFTKAELDTNGSSTATNFDPTDPAFVVELDPLLAPATGSELRFPTGSPFIDAGDSTANPATTDLLGNPRIDNIIELGAIETPDLSLFVDATATGTNDGSSFTNAFLSLEDALAAAVPGSVINIAEGTYTPAAAGDRAATFTIPDSIQVLGGFPAGNGNPSPNPARDPILHPTILSGDLDGNDTPGSDRSDNAFHVVTFNNAGVTTSFDGITITGGQADGTDATDQRGAGLLFLDSSPVVTNCLLMDNHAITSGGGVHVPAASAPSFRSCQFEANTAPSGAALSCNSSDPSFTDCSFINHTAALNGGAAFIESSAQPIFTSCQFDTNSATQVGGAAFVLASSPTFSECAFSSNSAFSGGALFADNASPILDACDLRGNNATNGGAFANVNGSTGELTSCLFESNTATDGGAILSDASQPTILACLLNGNTADRGGAIFNTNSPAPTITNTACQGNLANERGGAMFNQDSSPTIINLSAQGNAAIIAGGGLFDGGTSSPQYLNCIIWENVADGTNSGTTSSHGGEITAVPTFSHSLLERIDLSSTNSNLNGDDFNNDPRFLLPLSPFDAPQLGGSLIPRFDSPILNLGDDATNPTATDLNGSPRKIGTIDLGAVEHQGVLHVYSGDLNPAWPNQRGSLSDALREAIPAHTIFVQAFSGLRPRDESGGIGPDISFDLPEGVEIYGGFEIGQTLAERDPERRTILRGNVTTTFHVVTASNISQATLLDGFSIMDGSASGADIADQSGGGLLCDNASPRIRNCDFESNDSLFGGAGAHFKNNSSPTLLNCKFSNNTTTGNGAGLLIENSSLDFFIDCQFIANTADGSGGGLILTESSSLTINSCLFSGNTAGDLGGAISQRNDSTLLGANSIFSGNSAADGAALASTDSATTLFCNTLQGNAASTTGGALFAANSSLNLHNTIIWHNHANGDRSTSSASLQQTDSTLVFDSCLIENFSQATLDGFAGSANNLESTDPLFLGELDPAEAPNHTFGRSYHLRPGSPALDAGNFDFQFFDFAFVDAAGNNRFFNGAFDLGALEHQGFVFVDQNATGGNFGETWEDAYIDIQDALNEDPGHVLLVAEGLHIILDDASTDLNERQIYGGFQPRDTFDQRDPTSHPTTILNESPINRFSITNSSAHLEGLEIVNSLNGTTFSPGSIFGSNSIFTLKNCLSLSASITEQSKAHFTNCTIAGGSGLFIEASSAEFQNTLLENNFSSGGTDGGGAAHCKNATVSFLNCEFRDNDSRGGTFSFVEAGGGGAVLGEDSVFDFINCLFRGNRSLQNTSGPTLLVENGGALALYNSTGNLINCSFQGNLASNGGAIFFENSPFAVINCSLQGNVAAFDIFRDSRDQNNEQPPSGFGGAIFITGPAPSFTNTIIWHNSAGGSRSSQTASLEFDATLADPQLLPSFSHNLIENFTATELDNIGTSSSNLAPQAPFFFTELNADFIDDDESFINHTRSRDLPRDLRLIPGSSAIDGGDNSASPTTTDLRGDPRIQGSAINLGAIESSAPDLLALWETDLDGDGLPFGLEIAIGSDPNVHDLDTAPLPQLVGDDELGFIDLVSGYNPLANSFTIWVIERSLDLSEGSFEEVLRFDGPSGTLTTQPPYTGELDLDENELLMFEEPDIGQEPPIRAFFRLNAVLPIDQ